MDNVLQVSQISKIIKDIIDNEFILENKKIAGEISSFSVTRGTAYFVIKDSDAMLNCVMFNCAEQFKVGDNVIVEGSIKYYPKGGKLGLTAYSIRLAGVGELYKRFLEMKDKLEKEGLFDISHKKAIPSYMNRVGVVTSRTGAVIQDIINVRNRRNPNLDIVLYDAQVQGVLAKEQIIKGIKFFSNYDGVDCIIVARGGGSLEDLQVFNEEDIARAVYNCKKPIISAVGHETDFTIIDFVSDLRVPTPSAGAELVAYDLHEAKNTIHYYTDRITKSIKNTILDTEIGLRQNLSIIENCIKENLNEIKINVLNNINLMNRDIEKQIENTTHRVKLVLNTLDNVNPARVLNKGYNLVSKENQYQKDFSNIKINDVISIENNIEKLICLVNDKIKK